MELQMKTIISLLLLTLTSQVKAVDDDFAYRLVSEKLDGAIPEEFVRAAFSHESVEIHKEIAEKFAKPYEKKPWSDYRKIFVKEFRLNDVRFFLDGLCYIQNIRILLKLHSNATPPLEQFFHVLRSRQSKILI